jgi:hypothetical protein
LAMARPSMEVGVSPDMRESSSFMRLSKSCLSC